MKPLLVALVLITLAGCGSPSACHNVPPQYGGGNSCSAPSGHYNPGSGELEWE